MSPSTSRAIEVVCGVVFMTALYFFVQYITVVYFTTWASSGPEPKPFEWKEGWEEFICIYRECDDKRGADNIYLEVVQE